MVNTALHGWDMIDADHYFTWVESSNTNVYLAEINGIAVSTCAIIQNNNAASLEFVSTLKEYRRRKAAALIPQDVVLHKLFIVMNKCPKRVFEMSR